MRKSILVLSLAFMAVAAVSFTACKNTPKAAEETEATHELEATEKMAAAEYQCPMKCEDEKTYAEMGTCPVCEMDLKALTAEAHDHDHSAEGHTH